MRYLGTLTGNGIIMANGLSALNGLSGMNGLSGLNGLTTMNGWPGNNGYDPSNGLPMNDGSASGRGWNSFLAPSFFSPAKLGSNNWIDPELLGPLGVGNLGNVPGVTDNALDNRHIPQELKEMLCLRQQGGGGGEEEIAAAGAAFREYFSVLLELAWPRTAKLNVCCSDPAGANATAMCLDPDFVFVSEPEGGPGYEALTLAPHFLTEKFERGQQEALTAALIAKFNTLGQHLELDLLGHFDLGAAGTRFIGGRQPGFTYYLGSAWGNAFLDCGGEDHNQALCLASSESYGYIGRDQQYHGVPMFTCSGGSDYPTRESGKACFSADMDTNARDGCNLVAAVGLCDRMCVGGYCDANYPPQLNRTSTNVLYVYMSEYQGASSSSDDSAALAIAVSVGVVGALVVVAASLLLWKRQKRAKKAKEPVSSEPAAPSKASADLVSDEENATDGSVVSE